MPAAARSWRQCWGLTCASGAVQISLLSVHDAGRVSSHQAVALVICAQAVHTTMFKLTGSARSLFNQAGCVTSRFINQFIWLCVHQTCPAQFSADGVRRCLCQPVFHTPYSACDPQTPILNLDAQWETFALGCVTGGMCPCQLVLLAIPQT
jgi:hypothetical protein